MPLEETIPFISRGGNQYLIGFSVFNSQEFDFGIPIIDISLELVSNYTPLTVV